MFSVTYSKDIYYMSEIVFLVLSAYLLRYVGCLFYIRVMSAHGWVGRGKRGTAPAPVTMAHTG